MKYIIGISFLIVLFGCSYTASIQNFNTPEEYSARINRECENENVLVELYDGYKIEAEFINITEDSLGLLSDDSTRHMSTNKIYKLTYNSTSSGLMRGLAVGTVTMVATWLLLSTSDEPGAGFLAILLSPVEILAGVTNGAIRGDERSFIINDNYSKTSADNIR